jgi:molybdopterin synthase catalytic subunit
VVVAVSTPHRKDSFEACQYIIDTLKANAPIWKKEVFEDGEEWVSARPEMAENNKIDSAVVFLLRSHPFMRETIRIPK